MARRTNLQRSQSTREALLGAARDLFVRQGYAETSTPQVAQAAGVSRGALYHQYEDKLALFRAVIIQEARSISDFIERETQMITEARLQLAEGGRAYLRAMRDQGRCKLMLLEGPAVLGVDAMRRIDQESGAQILAEGLGAIAPDLPSELRTAYAEIISASFERCALAIAEGGDERVYEDAMTRLLDRLALP